MKDKYERSKGSKDMLRETLTEKPVVVLLDIDYTVFNTGRFKESGLRDYSLYPGDLEALEVLAKLADLGIFSQEAPTISQMKKLEETGVRKHFPDERVHLYADKLAEMRRVLEAYRSRRKIILVDDKLAVLDQAKRANPGISTVWVKRGPYAQQQPEVEGFKPDLEVDGLAKVVPFVQNLCAEFSERTTLGGARSLDRRGV